jgi:hypothetical protein
MRNKSSRILTVLVVFLVTLSPFSYGDSSPAIHVRAGQVMQQMEIPMTDDEVNYEVVAADYCC